jgi:hypothetical protein
MKSSDTIPYVYNTATMLRYGQVLKVTSDLMVPLWEHLWTEKADFRKSELFRTNESLIRMSEKESEKLIEVGNQFKADMNRYRYPRHYPVSLGTAFHILPEKAHCCNHDA